MPRREELGDTTFDDVAMILLFFFLVLIFFVFAKKFNDVELKTLKVPKPVKKTKLVKTHSDTDAFIYIDADQGIRIRNLGGVSDNRFTHDVEGRPTGGSGDWFTTEEEKTSEDVIAMLTEYYAGAVDYSSRRGGRKQYLRIFVSADPEGRYGVMHQVVRALSKVKKATIAQNAPLKLDVRPCPTMAGGTEMAEQLFKFNACVNRICTPGDSQCLQTFVHMATCNGEAGVKRNDIIKTFCRWPKIEEI